MAIGQDVDAGVLDEAHLTTNQWGHIAIDRATMATNLPGVFAGGDCATGAATVVEAVAACRRELWPSMPILAAETSRILRRQ